MAKLSVNINKVALIRNSREKNLPDILKVARDLIDFGAHGITVHPRPDGRHIRTQDIGPLRDLIAGINHKQNSKIEFNVEGYPSEDFLTLLEKSSPHQATLVPDPPEALTSNAGWDFEKNLSLLQDVTKRLKTSQIRVSLFLDPEIMTASQWDALRQTGCDRVELYTERYADAYPTPERLNVLENYKVAAKSATEMGLGVNAGHDLNLENLGPLLRNIPEITEVSIGHALICEALYFGFKETLHRYLEILKSDHVD